tara:strand:- start:369 stop:953 length:585 start_codon:yes stop_codon:yes gene_type:complete
MQSQDLLPKPSRPITIPWIDSSFNFAEYLYGYCPEKILVMCPVKKTANKPQEQFSSRKHDPIPGTQHLDLGKRLKERKHSFKTYTAMIRQTVASGMSMNECDVYGENFPEETLCARLHKVLSEMEIKLLAAEYSGQLPHPSPWVLFHRAKRKTNKTAIVLQKKDGTWPTFPREKYGAGVLFFGDTDPMEGKQKA